MMVHCIDQPEIKKGDGPIGVVVAPTRELVQQIFIEAKRYAKGFNMQYARLLNFMFIAYRVVAVYGGVSKYEQFKELKAGTEIVCATPVL